MPLHLTGGYNVHLVLLFDDGVEWLLRVPGYPLGPSPPMIRKRVRESEALTYRLMKSAGLPVAMVHDWGCGTLSSTSSTCYKPCGGDAEALDPHAAYIIYDRLVGGPDPDLVYPDDCEESKLRRLIGQHASIAIQLSSLTFNAIGSPTLDDRGDITIGNLVDLPHCDENGSPHFGDPFKTLRDRYLYVIDINLEAIRKGYMHRSGLLLPYLAHLALRQYVISLDELSREEETFYLPHPDLHSDNVLTDGVNITGLVDWEW